MIDSLVSKGMTRALDAGLYPDAVGTHQVFGNWREDPENPAAMARPAAAVVCGLGPEGKLRAIDLVFTVRQAVIAYAQWLADREGVCVRDFEMAATLIGSGGTGISVGGAAILSNSISGQGLVQANQNTGSNAVQQNSVGLTSAVGGNGGGLSGFSSAITSSIR